VSLSLPSPTPTLLQANHLPSVSGRDYLHAFLFTAVTDTRLTTLPWLQHKGNAEKLSTHDGRHAHEYGLPVVYGQKLWVGGVKLPPYTKSSVLRRGTLIVKAMGRGVGFDGQLISVGTRERQQPNCLHGLQSSHLWSPVRVSRSEINFPLQCDLVLWADCVCNLDLLDQSCLWNTFPF
jgi:hypothetical protein